MNHEELSKFQKQLIATYGGTTIETICRELTAVDNPDVDPDFRPRVMSGRPWWTMKIPQALKYLPLLEKAWDEGHHAGQHNEHEYRQGRAMTNPYRQETEK